MVSERSLSVFSPAKINLFLAITGARDDGFHNLISLVTPLEFGDDLTLTLESSEGANVLTSSSETVPLDSSNLVLKAAALFRQKTEFEGHFSFHLEKNIPVGAGLGGGSSNAAAALTGMNKLLGQPLSESSLHDMAAELGSDCPLFLKNKPVVMRGRGELLQSLASEASEALSGRSVLLFKPGFSISTPWAYRKMKEAKGACYLSAEEIEKKLSSWLVDRSIGNLPLLNNMQEVSFQKYLGLPVLLDKLLSDYGLQVLMSGSGSACFALIDDDSPLEAIRQTIFESWGKEAFVKKTKII